MLLLAQTMQAQTINGGRINTYAYDNWANNAWQPYQRGSLAYDAQNYMTQILLETNTMGVWANYLKANNTNSATGKVVLQMVSLWAAGGWTPNNRTTSTYTAADKVSTDLRESYYSGAWSNSSKATYLYNASNFLTQKIEFGYSAGSWLNDRRTTYTNNAAGVETQHILEKAPTLGAAYANSERVTSTLNANNLPTKKVTALWTGAAWADNQQEITAGYNANNNPTSVLTQFKNGTVWVDSLRDNYTYTPTLVTIIHQGYGSGVWQNRYRVLYNITQLTAAEAVTLAENTVSVYPNPSTGVVNLQVTNDIENAIVTIQNASGQLVRMLPRSTITANTTLDLADLANGLYFIRIISGKGQIYQHKNQI